MVKSFIPVLIAVILVFSLLAGTGVLGSVTGFTTLSISKVDFISNSNIFNDKAWMVTVSQGGLGQSLSGVTASSSKIASMSGTTPEKDLSLSLDTTSQTCEYAINSKNTEEGIYNYTLKEWSLLDITKSAENQCTASYYAKGKYSSSLTNFCILREKIAQPGSIDTPYIRTITKVTVGNGIKTESKVFDTKGVIDGSVGNDVYAVWNGYTITGRCTDYSSDNFAFYKQGEWKIGDKDKLDSYKVSAISLSNLIGSTSISQSQLKNIVSSINSYSSQAVNPVSIGSIKNPSSLSSAMLSKDIIASTVGNSQWVFYIKADWLGVVQPVPMPKIISVSSSEFKAGSNGEIYALIQNTGESGNINVWAECSSPFDQVGNTLTQTLNKNEQKPYYIQISASSNQPVLSTCKVYAKSLNTVVSKSVSVSVDPINICEPNDKYCSAGSKIVQCNSYGTGTITLNDCSAQNLACGYDLLGSPICQSESATADVDCQFFDISCQINKFQSNLNSVANTVLIAGIIIIGILVILSIVGIFIPWLSPYFIVSFIRRII